MTVCLKCITMMKDFIVDNPLGRLFRNDECEVCGETGVSVLDMKDEEFKDKLAWSELADMKLKETK